MLSSVLSSERSLHAPRKIDTEKAIVRQHWSGTPPDRFEGLYSPLPLKGDEFCPDFEDRASAKWK